MPKSKTVLMCPPVYFDINYEINPWMDSQNKPDKSLAAKQWRHLYDTYTQQLGWDVLLMEPAKGLPDLVFTGNGGLVYGGQVILPRFKFPQRQPETAQFKKWFEQAGYQDLYQPSYDFEGEAEAFVWRGKYLICSHGFRSDRRVFPEIARALKLEPIILELADPKLYHLDACLTVIDDRTIALYPPAFKAAGLRRLLKLKPEIIEATADDAAVFGLNAILEPGHAIVMPEGAVQLANRYREYGLEVFEVPVSEFIKAGGAVKCLTLQLN